MGEKPPAHWLLWSYAWRYTLLIVVPLSVVGMYLGMRDSTGHAAHSDPEMVANIAMFGVVFGGLGQLVAFGVAIALFLAATPARRQWAAHRDAVGRRSSAVPSTCARSTRPERASSTHA